MRRTLTIALTASAVLGLSACGGGAAPMTQEQSRDALLTDAEFPLDGFTAGEISEGTSDDTSESLSLEEIVGDDQLSKECSDAWQKLDTLEADFTAKSSVDFTSDGAPDPLFGEPPTVSLIVASLEDGDSPLDAFDALNAACDDFTIEESGMSMTLGFSDVEGDAQGTKMTMTLEDQRIDLTMAGRQSGDNYTLVTGAGVADADLMKVLDAQEEKVADL